VHLYEVLRRPLVTEKNTALQAQGKYVFEIAKGANKQQVREAVEKAFKVKVLAVNMVTVPGKAKTRRAGRRPVLTQSGKKAVVTLRIGDKIELFGSV